MRAAADRLRAVTWEEILAAGEKIGVTREKPEGLGA